MFKKINGLLSNQANLATAFIVALILFVGPAIVDRQANTLVIFFTVLSVFAIIFAYFNAKSLIKGAITFLVTILASSFALQVGSLLDPKYGSFGFTWMGSTIALTFMLLSISYLFLSNHSRWSCIMVSQLIMFTVIYMCAMSHVDLYVSLGIGLTSSIIYFVVIYFVLGHNKIKNMPKIAIDKDNATAFCENVKEHWNTVIQYDDQKTGCIFVWNDNHIYALIPVLLKESLSFSGRRRCPKELMYQDAPLNSWLLYIINSLPTYKTRGAPITPVLLDLSNTNGTTNKIIGAAIPDSNRVSIVGIVPAKNYYGKQESIELINSIDDMFATLVPKLKPKHIKALNKLGENNE